MNIDKKIEECLTHGHLNISICLGVWNVLLIEGDEEIERVRSDRGLEYTVRILIGKVLGDGDFIAHTEKEFPLVLSPITNCEYARFLTNAFMTVCFVDKQVRIKHYKTGMEDHMDIPGPIQRRTTAKTYSEAIKKILHAIPERSRESVY